MQQLAKALPFVLIFGTASVEADAEDTRSLGAQLVGHWGLVSMEVVRGDVVEYPLGRDVSGLITYDESGHMAVQIMQGNRPPFASGDQSRGTPAELAAAVGGYVAYFGTYSVDEAAGVVTHHIAGSLFPNWVGTDQRRTIALQGRQLTLSTPPITFQGQARVFRVVWTRQE